MSKNEERQINKQKITKRYEELKELLCDYGLKCSIVEVRNRTMIYIQAENLYEEYNKVYVDEEGKPWTDIARLIIDDYVSTFQYI